MDLESLEFILLILADFESHTHQTQNVDLNQTAAEQRLVKSINTVRQSEIPTQDATSIAEHDNDSTSVRHSYILSSSPMKIQLEKEQKR